MDKSLLTTAASAASVGSLSALLDHVDDHVNGNMTVAHGLNLQASDYTDSHGDLLATQVAVFLVSGRTYYSPVQATAIPMTDTVLPNPQRSARLGLTVLSVGPSESVEVAAVNTLLNNHASKRMEESHGGLTVEETDSFDSSGHRVGRHLVRFNWNGAQQSIIADLRSDGPPKAPRITGPDPGSVYTKEGNLAVVYACGVTGEGTLTYKWQWFNSVAWVDLTDGGTFGNRAADPPEVVVNSTSTLTLLVTRADVATSYGSVYTQRQFRLKVTSSAFPGEEFYSDIASLFVKAIVS
jgi:hypothetical protein